MKKTKVTSVIHSITLRVRTHLGETGTIIGPAIRANHFTVRIDNSKDRQNPRRWIGDICEDYATYELTKIS